MTGRSLPQGCKDILRCGRPVHNLPALLLDCQYTYQPSSNLSLTGTWRIWISPPTLTGWLFMVNYGKAALGINTVPLPGISWVLNNKASYKSSSFLGETREMDSPTLMQVIIAFLPKQRAWKRYTVLPWQKKIHEQTMHETWIPTFPWWNCFSNVLFYKTVLDIFFPFTEQILLAFSVLDTVATMAVTQNLKQSHSIYYVITLGVAMLGAELPSRSSSPSLLDFNIPFATNASCWVSGKLGWHPA